MTDSTKKNRFRLNKELYSLVKKFKKALPDYQSPSVILLIKKTIYPNGSVINYPRK